MEDPCESFNELIDTPLDFSAFVMNRLKVDTLTPELLAGPTFELMKGSCKSLVEHEYFFEEVYKATTDQLDWNNPEGHQYPHVTKTKVADYGNIKWIEDLVPNTMESARVVYSKRTIIAVTKLQIAEWHNYKHLDWITVHRDDDKLYTFKEGDFNRLRIQDIEYISGASKECGKTSIRCRDYQKKLNLTKSGYNKDKKNRLMRIDKLHKFSDGTLNDVRTAFDDRLKGI
ncbi:hypothetical protein Tco_1437024 [Tanacetum coccineum]